MLASLLSPRRLRRSASVNALAFLLTALSASGCATFESAEDRLRQDRASSKRSERNVSSKKKKSSRATYELYGKRKELDRKLLRRGERAQYAPALDSY